MNREVENKEEIIQRILERDGLPSLSPLAVQLVRMATDESNTASDLAFVIEKDPGLATRLLKLVGSAYFARPNRVASVAQAVVLLGFKRVRIMALTLSLRDTFPMGRKGGVDFDLFWKTSLYRALIAREFARSSGQTPDPEEAFIGGLILEIGMLMLHDAVPGKEQAEFPGHGISLEEITDWEEQRLGVNHREVGSMILERWNFSEQLVESQRYFGEQALQPARQLLCKVTELARRATHIVFVHPEDLFSLHAQARDLLGMEPDSVNRTISQTFQAVEGFAEQLRLEVDSNTDMIGVMEMANQALARIHSAMETSLQAVLDRTVASGGSNEAFRGGTDKDGGEILENTLEAVAHEIRNPLLAIGGFANRLARQAGEEGRGGKYAMIIAQESARLEGVLREIVDYSRAYEPVATREDMVPILDEALDGLQGMFREKGFELVRDFKRDAVHVRIEPSGISRTITILCRNSFSMLKDSSGRVVVSLGPANERKEVRMSIWDNGAPMPEGLRDALLHANLSARTFGDGLAIPLARKIIRAHRGRIELEEREGRGNRINIFLPLSLR
jgi:HD-like signal output (HDOD) protein